MSKQDRRQFLKFGVSAATSAAVLAALPKSIQAALATPANRVSGTLQDVEHIIVLMQENRSFDHYFGTFNGVRGFGDPRPVPLPSGRTVWYQPVGRHGDRRSGHQNVGFDHWHEKDAWYEGDPAAQNRLPYVLPFRLNAKKTRAQYLQGTDHSWKLEQGIFKNWDVWVPLKSEMSMGYFHAKDDLPFYYQLANAFTICDAYHCSIFGNTEPNRQYYTSGASVYTMSGHDGNTKKRLKGQELDNNWTGDMDKDEPWSGLSWKSYAQQLQEHGVAWKVYQALSNYGCNSFAYHSYFRKLDKSSELYARGRAYTPAQGHETPAETVARAIKTDVERKQLPSVAWVICPDAYCEHPTACPAAGQEFVDKVLEALTSDPDTWSKTIFILNYDENDGLFDHVPPYVPPVNTRHYGYQGLSTVCVDEENYNGVPIGLGPRVPMLVVSPWSKGGWVCSQVFDHTSVLRLIEKRFGVKCDNISPWRRTVCGDLTSAFDFKTPDAAWVTTLPDTSGYVKAADEVYQRTSYPQRPASQTKPIQARGQRPARPLPYEMRTAARVDPAARKVWLDFANPGAAGAPFIVYQREGTLYDDSDKVYDRDDTVFTTPNHVVQPANDHQGPWQYTVEAGKSLSDSWAPSTSGALAGIYHLSVYGPNGYYYECRGSVDAKTLPEVTLEYIPSEGNVALRLENPGPEDRIFVVANAFNPDHPRTVRVAAGTSAREKWDLSRSSRWFDLLVTTEGEDPVLRRFAGHVETGQRSATDPRMGGEALELR
ncbi:phospholipase C, phosphocholine-specific [Pendulispora rubella]|uniref:phospholipase C n=1 Tax=Pendulispora rubella TaxID=2741070 RepID=A0ABZ2L4V0_9BACT